MLHRFLAVLVLASGLAAQSAGSAATVTASGRDLAVAFDSILGGSGKDAPGLRTLFLLIDPGAGLSQANFVSELQAGLARNAARLGQTSLAVGGVGVRGTVTCAPTMDRSAVVDAVRKLVAGGRDEIRNVYADVRVAAASLGGAKGDRELILVALQNGDAEDDLEATVRELERHEVRFRCIASEAYFADSYWTVRPHTNRPSKTTLTGGDSAFVDLPWGWILQSATANEVAPSGFATYGLNRLAAATGGRAHLYSPPNTSAHQCAIFGRCLFCEGDHAPSVDIYWRTRLSHYAPSAADRATVFREAGSDPWFRATLKVWNRANKAGLVRGTPSVRLTGNGLTEQRARARPTFSIGSMSFASQAKRALKLERECERILKGFERELDSLGSADQTSKGIPRYRAIAEYTRLMLQLTRVNLITYAGWCREVAPVLVGKSSATVVPPQKASPDQGRRPSGVGLTNFCLCHGVAPFDDVELPGGPKLRTELAALRTLTDRFELTTGHTPLGIAVHRAGVAGFYFTYPGILTKGKRPRPRSSNEKNPLTERGRPARPGRSSGGSAGPTTGR